MDLKDFVSREQGPSSGASQFEKYTRSLTRIHERALGLSRFEEQALGIARIQERLCGRSRFEEHALGIVRTQERALGFIEAQRRATTALLDAATGVRTWEVIKPLPPLGNALSKMGEQSRSLPNLAKAGNTSAICNSVLDAARLGDAFRSLPNPIAELTKPFPPMMGETWRSMQPPFGPLRYTRTLADLERGLDFLRNNSFAEMNQARSTVRNAINGISALVDIARPFVDPAITTTVAGRPFSLFDAVAFVGSQFDSTVEAAAGVDVIELLREMQESLRRLEQKGDEDRKINFWLALLGILISLISPWPKSCHPNNNSGVQCAQKDTMPALRQLRSTQASESDIPAHWPCP
jgi:hypothetical protein